jgi:serine/threonine-protein kinase
MTDPASTQVWRIALDEAERLEALAPGERAAALEAMQRQDPALHAKVRTLLSEAGTAAPAIDAAKLLREAALSTSGDLAGQQVGPYRFVRLLGSGGMGQVWLAERTDGRFEGQVAIKLLGTALHSERLERFRREGQLLARLAHPFIARLLDAGSLPSGQPYLVLEHVDGQRIDRWCDDARLDIDARLRLFIDVCVAVAHAHANLVVHRDLKPSNILVGAGGAVKLLDFGIAKLIETETGAAEETALTRLAGRAMTPEYAAPEQVSGEPITTATDVYALGVLLYELLSGQRPYAAASASPIELARHIVEIDPRPLGATEAAADRRGTTAERLRRARRGDLENIVAKALKKDPRQRYAGAQALADDLMRVLRREPVLARPDRFAYRSAKFVRRHRVPVAAAGLVAVALGVGLGLALWQAEVARAERAAAEQQAEVAAVARGEAQAEARRAVEQGAEARRQSERAEQALELARAQSARAERNAEQAQQQARRADTSASAARAQTAIALAERDKTRAVKDFLIDLFETSSILREGPVKAKQISARELLERGAIKLQAQADAVPEEVRAELLQTLAQLHAEIGDLGHTVALYTQAIDSAKRLKGPAHPEVAKHLVDFATALIAAGDFARAEALLAEAGPIFEAHRDLSSAERGQYHVNLSLLHSPRDAAAATRHAERAVAILERAPPNRRAAALNLRTAYTHLGHASIRQGDFQAAEAHHRRSLELALRHAGAEHPYTAVSYANLGEVLRMRGRLQESEAAAREAVRVARLAAPEDRVGIAQTELRHGVTLSVMGERAAARSSIESALAAFEAATGADGGFTLYARQTLASTALREGDLNEAGRQLDALDAAYARKAPPRSTLGSTLLHRTRHLLALGDLDGARRTADRALELIGAAGSARGLGALEAQYLLADIELQSGQHEAALRRWREAMGRHEPRGVIFPGSEVRLALLEGRAALARGDSALALERFGAGRRLIEEAVDAATRGELLREALSGLARAQMQRGRPELAQPLLEHALELAERSQAPLSPRLAEAQLLLAQALLARGEVVRARDLAERARTIHAGHSKLDER